jgi:hypothetical protein
MYTNRGLFFLNLSADNAKVFCASCSRSFYLRNIIGRVTIQCPSCEVKDDIDEDTCHIDWNEG